MYLVYMDNNCEHIGDNFGCIGHWNKLSKLKEDTHIGYILHKYTLDKYTLENTLWKNTL